MKKALVLFCAVLMAITLLSGCQGSDADNDNKSTDTITNESVNTSTGTSSADKDADSITLTESLREKLLREIEGAYYEEMELPESSTTYGMIELADKYTQKWKQVADEYYDKIMEYDGIIKETEDYYSSDEFHIFVSNMKTNWEQYNQVQCENYSKTLRAIYARGTIVGPLFADYKYELQKEWALQLVGIYQQL